MSIPRPTGGYAEPMLQPGGWPDADEDTLYARARTLVGVLQQVTEVVTTCQRQQADVFEGGSWSGGAAAAANREMGVNVEGLNALQNGVATAITWHDHVAGAVERAKSTIIDNIDAAHEHIEALNDADLDAAELQTAIGEVVATTHGVNVGVVAATAEQVLATKNWTPPRDALQDLLDRRTPPPYTPSITPGEGGSGVSPVRPAPDTTPDRPARPQDRPLPVEDGAGDGTGSEPNPPGTPSVVPGTGPVVPPAVVPGTGPMMPPTAAVTSPATARPPSSPPRTSDEPEPATLVDDTESAQPPVAPAASVPDGRSRGMAPASVSAPVAGAARADEAPAVAPAATTAPAPGAVPPAVPPASAGSGSGAGSGTRSGRPPVGTPAKKTSPRVGGPGQRPPVGSTRAKGAAAPDAPAPAAVAAAVVIPVSAARAERDAITAQGSGRRRGEDPVHLARRIAAALNAPGGAGADDYGFFWITAITEDGVIVVANSYGVAYIPAGVHLPEQVTMASADETIPAALRASWATYPASAVAGWAAHHDVALRAVFATAEQFTMFDPGAAKMVLAPDDIPEHGDMPGRSRLQIVNPAAARRLSMAADKDLVDDLPPATIVIDPPADQQPDPDAPDPEFEARMAEFLAGDIDFAALAPLLPLAPAPRPPSADRRPALWFDVMQPMFSDAAGREVAHLRAFDTYAVHARDVLLAEAHGAQDPIDRRATVADWLYWQHLADLLASAGIGTPER